MIFARPSSRAALFALLLPSIAPLHAALIVAPTTIGNIFLSTETVSIPVSGTGTTVEWRVTNFFGEEVDAGANSLTGVTQIRPSTGELGWFLLDLTEKDAVGGVISTLQTRFAIITPINVSTMGNSPFGVQTHFSQNANTALFGIMARAGFARFRDELYWNTVENPKNVFNYSTFDAYMSAAAVAQVKPLITLDWANQFYDWDTTSGNPVYTAPYTDNGRAGFANYALQTLNQYPGQIDSIEGWNEYNAGTYVKGPATTNRGYYYSKMMQTIWETVKPDYPSVTIVGGASVPVADGFFKSVFDNGGLPYMDALSVHPYRAYPEGVDLEIGELDALVKSYNGGVSKPIWATEFSQNVTSVSQQMEAASYLVRISTQMLAAGVRRMYYYLLHDWGSSFACRGLVGKVDTIHGSFLPNPAFAAYAVMIRELYGWTYQARVKSGIASTTYIYRFGTGSARKYVCWSTAPTTVSFSTSASSVNVTDIMGNVTAVTPTGDVVSVALNADATYLLIPGGATSVAEASNPVIADSVADYSKTQGANGWYYGYVPVPSGSTYNPASFVQMSWSIWKLDNYRWKAGDYPFIGQDQMHPSGNWVVRRWVSGVSAVVDLTGNISVGNSYDGVRAHIFVNGVEKYNRLLSPNQSVAYNVENVAVAEGSNVDFAVDINSNMSNDSTGFTARITLDSQ